MTWQVLDKAMAQELLRFDPRKIPTELLEFYFVKLGALSMFDKFTDAFAAVGWSEALDDAWHYGMFTATNANQKETVRRLLQMHPRPDEIVNELDFGARLLLASDDPVQTGLVLERTSLEALKSEDESFLTKFAFGLLVSRFHALGVFVARSLIPLLSQKDANFLFEQILETRDKIGLPPDDPFSDIIDERLRKHNPLHVGRSAAALKQAQQRLGDKVNQVQELQQDLDAMREQLRRREEAPTPAEPTPTTEAPAQGPTNEELREKVESLKAALKQRHLERNELRRELQKTQSDLEELRQTSTNKQEENNHDPEDELLMPEEALGTQPVRLMEFPHGFLQKLTSIPKPVARAAITMSGRLAAGEPSAFVGAVRLKACPTIMRLRLGIDFRLLFKLLPDRLLVVELIPRQDLERRIKTLS